MEELGKDVYQLEKDKIRNTSVIAMTGIHTNNTEALREIVNMLKKEIDAHRIKASQKHMYWRWKTGRRK